MKTQEQFESALEAMWLAKYLAILDQATATECTICGHSEDGPAPIMMIECNRCYFELEMESTPQLWGTFWSSESLPQWARN